MTRFQPADINQLREAVGEALLAEEPVELIAGGSKRGLGRPLQTAHTLDLSHLSGIRDYAPSELVLTAGAATPLTEIERALGEAGQMLAFEPPDWRGFLGVPDEDSAGPTLGGVLACNLSGPRRVKAGAARDHFLGFRGVSGRGEVFKAGGKVVKNVTGYDLPKLMAGSYGTLAALEEVTIKVLPRAEAACTVVLYGLDPPTGVTRLTRALASPHEVSGAAYLPASLAATPISSLGPYSMAALRLEGPPLSVAFRRERLLAELASDCEAAVLEAEPSAELWRSIRDVAPLSKPVYRVIWRVSVVPSRGAELGDVIARGLDAGWYLDWGGGLLWVAVAGAEDGGAAVIRGAIRGPDGQGAGHATLIRGSPALRHVVPVFEPQAPPLAALAARVKLNFDPQRILNPGRMVEGS